MKAMCFNLRAVFFDSTATSLHDRLGGGGEDIRTIRKSFIDGTHIGYK
jgi:hypothetical protein